MRAKRADWTILVATIAVVLTLSFPPLDTGTHPGPGVVPSVGSHPLTDSLLSKGSAVGPTGAPAGPSPPARSGPSEPPGAQSLWLGGFAAPPPVNGRPSAISRFAGITPYATYTAEPAPMGLGDFGVDHAGSAYTYFTPAFQATAQIRSYSTTFTGSSSLAGNQTTLQLNVVLVLSRGSSLAEYWIQDVPILNTSSHLVQIENNVWNFSNTQASLPSNSVSGNGTVYSFAGQQFYAASAAGYPGSGVVIGFPGNISTRVVASNLSGLTHVGFEYNDGYGWVTYDNVTFPWTQGWTDHGFEVTGSGYNPLGIFDDAEWVIGGPGSGRSMRVLSANLSMTLEAFNGHNFESVPNAYNFGGDTAESAVHVSTALPTSKNPGAPSDLITAGTASLGPFYGAANLSIVNVSAPVANGTLRISGAPVPYRGHTANVTVLPGSYRFSVENQSSVVASKNATVTATQYLPLTFARFALGPNRSASLARTWANGTGFLAGSTVSVFWPGNTTAQCRANASSNGSFSCAFSVPLVAAGTYNVSASDNAASADMAWSNFLITTNLTVQAAASAIATDLGGPIEFWANASGGYPPYASYLWNFGDGARAQTTLGRVNYTFLRSGSFTVVTTVRDRVGDTWSASVSVRIRADPSVTGPIANRSSADVGQAAGFTVTGSLGLAPYTYAWSGLPAGCQPTVASAICSNLSGAGSFAISVTVTDSQGVRATGLPLSFRVYEDPRVAALTNLRPYLDVGENLSLVATATLGSGGFTYQWSGLPTGCRPSANSVDCPVNSTGSLVTAVTAWDSNGASATSPPLNQSVAADPTVQVGAGNHPSSDLGRSTVLFASVAGGSGSMTFLWSGLPVGCAPANRSTIACTPAATGTYDIAVEVVDESGATARAVLPFTVFTSPSLRWADPPPANTDVGHSFELRVVVSGGLGPFQFDWSGLPPGCAGVDGDRLNCDPSGSGSFSITANVTDIDNGSAAAFPVPFSVHPSPRIALLSASSPRVVAGYPITFSADVQGGTGNDTLQWHSLPIGCNPKNTSRIVCDPSGPGTYQVSLLATDQLGESANATVQVVVIASVLGLPPYEGYAVIALGLSALAVVLVLAFRWVRRSGRRVSGGGPNPPPGAPRT